METLRLVALGVITILLFLQCGQKSDQVEVLEVAEFKERLTLESASAVLIDVRTAKEVNDSQIPGAINIDYFQDDFEKTINALDKNAVYFVYCRSGNRSNKAATLMMQNDFTQVYDLKGGIKAWVLAGEKVE